MIHIENPKDSIIKWIELINSVELQDTKSICKNLLHFYTLINYRKRNKENNPIYNHIRNNKIPRNKFNQGGERLVHRKL